MQDNNQNMNIQNENNQNTEKIEIQPEQVEENKVEEEKKKESSKNKNLIIAILALIIVLLVAYIVDDKFIHNEEEKPVPVEEKVPEKETEKQEEPKDDKEYIREVTKIIPINGKTLTLEFKYFITPHTEGMDEGEATYYLEYFTFINGKKVSEAELNAAYLFGGEYSKEEAKNKALNEYSSKIDEAIADVDSNYGKINGDKEYFYFKNIVTSEIGNNIDLLVFNEDGKEIFKRNIEAFGRMIKVDSSCPNYTYFQGEENAYITENIIYYIEDDMGCGNEIFTQYKITFENNKANFSKVADCKVVPEGACN